MAALPHPAERRSAQPCAGCPTHHRIGTIGRPTHRRVAAGGVQRVWIVFGGRTDLPWLRLLRPGFRHCFAALADPGGWLVLDPLSGRLVAARLDLPPGFDLPEFYRRAGLRVLGPFVPQEPQRRWLPAIRPLTCVGLCRAVLGAGAPRAITPHGLYRRLRRQRGGDGDIGFFS